jgi:oligopeptide transport system ATP-binding protein
MEEILRVSDLRSYFFVEEGVVKAVDGVSFTLKRGETLGIVGESGSGKTVTSLSILRLIATPPGRIVSGQILLDGRDLLKLSNRELRDIRGNVISMIFQDPMTSLNPVFTVGDQIRETLEIHQGFRAEQSMKRAVELLKEVGIPNPEVRANQYPHEYSGGMRQRAMIAMAMSCRPKILIADEPTTALDVTIQAQILELMNRMKEEIRNSIILITHDLGVIAEMADRILIMYAGKIVERGEARTIFYNPAHPYTWGLLASIPRLERREKEKLIPIRGNPPSVLKLPGGCAFNPRCAHAMDICFRQTPELHPVDDPEHLSACHLDLEEVERIRKTRGKPDGR